MVLDFKIAVMCLTLLGVGSVGATDEDYLTIDYMEVREISVDVLNQEVGNAVFHKRMQVDGRHEEDSSPDSIEDTGKIISVAKDLVALGEDIYKLVVKGKPTNTTKYSPISVIPKEKGEAVDVMSTENWKVPKKYTYEVTYVNFYGWNVVKFRYAVVFAYGGTYNGKGAYLTSVQIIPESVSTLYGYDFTATMKLGGIQNNGTRDNPVAGATLLMEYTISTILKASTEVATVFVTGNGGFKKY